jgi:hypothetical protein
MTQGTLEESLEQQSASWDLRQQSATQQLRSSQHTTLGIAEEASPFQHKRRD